MLTARQEQDKRGREIREKLQGDAEKFVVALADVLSRKGVDAKAFPNHVSISKPRAVAKALLEVEGHDIDLGVKQKIEGSGWSFLARDRLDVSMPWIWVGYKVIKSAKKFGWSKSRPGTFGFDLDVIADYILVWIQEKIAAEEAQRNKFNSLEQSRAIRDAVKSKFKVPDFLDLEATPGGLRLTLVCNQAQAESILRAIGAPDLEAVRAEDEEQK